MKNLVICGGGSSAHTLIPLLKDSGFNVSIYTSRPGQWAETVEMEWHDPKGQVLGRYSGDIKQASHDPALLFPDADYVVFCMPVHKYRVALHEIAPYLNKDKTVFLGTMYGQGGWNWMVEEIKKKYCLQNIVTFAFGLIPWICRIIEYGQKGVFYGCKAVNYAAVAPHSFFQQVDDEFFEPVCYRWFGKGKVEQSDNFLSLTLSVDNQIIHPSRCLGLYMTSGGSWKSEEDVPWFYRDYDDTSAKLLSDLDNDYSLVRESIRNLYPEMRFRHMMDYLALERFSYLSSNTDIRESFVTSQTLGSIKTPVIRSSTNGGNYIIDPNHRFFLDDIYYGICIVKWMAEKLKIDTPTIEKILRWAQDVRRERIIDSRGTLLLDSPDLTSPFKTGIPSVYGFIDIQDCLDWPTT